MADCDDRQLSEAARQAGYQNGRTGVAQALRPFSGRPTLDNLLDYINRELVPAVRRTRDKVNDIYLPAVDNAPSGNPLGFYFSTSTVNADPTTGRVRLDASPQNTATTIRVSESNGRLADVAPWLDVMAGGATTPLGVVTLSDAVNPTRFIRFDLTAMADQGAYWDLTVDPIEWSHADPFVDGGGIVLSFIPGVGGSTPATVPGTSISGADGPRQFLSSSTSTAVDFRSLSAIFPGAPIYDVMAYPFSAAGNGSTDDLVAINAAIVAANATGGVVYLGTSHRISAGLTAITGSCVVLAGRGPDPGGTSLLCTTAPAAIITITGRYSGVMNMRVGCLTASVSGYAVVLSEAFRPFVQNVRTLAVGNGVEIDRCNTTRILDVEVTQVLGAYGFYAHGVDPDFCHNTRYERCKVATEFPLEEELMRGDWAASTSYLEGEFVRANGGMWQVSTAGTSAGAGSGPSGLPSSSVTAVYTTPVTDGTVQWLYVSGSYTGFAHGSFAHTVAYEYCGAQHGYYGMHVFDDQGDAPALVNAWRFSCDKPHQRGIFIEAGDNLEFDQTFITSAMQAAVEVGADAHSWQFLGGQLYAQAREGVIIGGSGGKLVGVEVAGSSTEPSNTYDGVSITAGVTDVVIDGCTIGNIPGRNSGARYCISIGAGCDRYAITSNILIGGDTGAILDGTAGRSDTRVIADNLPDTEIAAGSVWGLTIDHGSSDVPREVTKFELGEQIRFATNPTPDTTSSGTIQTYTVAETTTQILLQLAGAVVVRGLTIITGKRIVFHFDAGSAGSFTFNHEDGSAAAAGNRIRCPGGVALTMVAGDSVALERFENRWRVTAVSRGGVGLTDGDKGHIVVSGAGTVWLWDTTVAITGAQIISTTTDLTFTVGEDAFVNATGDVVVNAAGGVAIHSGATPKASATNNRVTVSADDQVVLEPTVSLRLFTAGVERLEIEPDGAWQLGGATGTIGHTIVTAGASAPPAWGQVPTAGIADAAITLAKQANLAQSRIIGRAEGAGTGVPTALTPTEVVSIIDGEAVTWTGSHTFNGTDFTVSTGAGNVTIGASSGQVTLSASSQVQITSPTRLASSVSLDSVLTTATTAADNLAIGSVNAVRFTGPVDPLTGMVPAVDGQTVALVNAHASVNMAILIENTSSSAANRFAGVGTSRVIRPGELALAWYDGTSDRWRLLCREDADL